MSLTPKMYEIQEATSPIREWLELPFVRDEYAFAIPPALTVKPMDELEVMGITKFVKVIYRFDRPAANGLYIYHFDRIETSW